MTLYGVSLSWLLVVLQVLLSVDITYMKVANDANGQPDTRIIMGEETYIELHQYLISLHTKAPFGNSYVLRGGAFIASTYWAVTAAHALFEDASNTELLSLDVMILVGGINQSQHMYGFTHHLVYRATHPDFNKAQLEDGFDIGLIKVKEPFTFPNEQKIPLAGTTYPYNIGDVVMIMGWGLVDPAGTFRNWMDKLNYVELNILPPERCHKEGETMSNLVFCAGEKDEQSRTSKDSCLGDSGGPVVQNNAAIGIVSYGNGHGGKLCGLYGVYTMIGKHVEWIVKTVSEMDGQEAVYEISFVG